MHQIDAGGSALDAEQLLTALHVGNPLGGQRVAAQIGISAAVIEPRGLSQFLKHADKARRFETGLRGHAVADPVSLTLHVARKIELGLYRHRLTAHHHGLRRLGAAAGGQQAQDHGANHERRLLLLLREHACNVPLGDVAEFVRQYRGQFVLAGDHADESQVHTHVATGQGKRIHAFVAHQDHVPGELLIQLERQFATQLCRLSQPLPHRAHILGQHRVVDDIRVTQDFTHDAVAQPAFFAQGDLTAVPQTG